MLELIGYVGAMLVGVAAGVWGYRYALKRDPEALERLAREIRDRT